MRKYWLLVAALLLALSGWLMSRGDPVRPARARADMSKFRRWSTPAEQDRARRRRTHVPPEQRDSPAPSLRDPVMLALPHVKGTTTVVVEASAIRDTPVGKHFLDCVLVEDEPDGRQRLADKVGFDPFERVDRVAVSGDVFVLQGDFSGARWDEVCRDGNSRKHGSAERICDLGGPRGNGLAVVDDLLIVARGDAGALDAAIDRLDGKLLPPETSIAEWSAYGEIYGTVSIDTIASLVARDDERLAERMRAAAEEVELHVGLVDDVYVVADVTGRDDAETRELAKSLGAGLSLARIQARAQGDEKLGLLLDMARIDPKDGRFSVDLAIPMDVLIEKLAPCRRTSEKR